MNTALLLIAPTFLHTRLLRLRCADLLGAAMMKSSRLLHRAVLVVAAFHSCTAANVARAGNWPGWRGPTGMGYTDEKDLPLTWDAKTGKLTDRQYSQKLSK